MPIPGVYNPAAEPPSMHEKKLRGLVAYRCHCDGVRENWTVFCPRSMCMANPNLKDERHCFISYSQEEVGKYHLNDEYYNNFNFKS